MLCRSVKPLQRYGHFSIFQDGGRPPFLFFKAKFLSADLFGGAMCVTVPNFVLIGQTVAEISQSLDFS